MMREGMATDCVPTNLFPLPVGRIDVKIGFDTLSGFQTEMIGKLSEVSQQYSPSFKARSALRELQTLRDAHGRGHADDS